MKIIRYILLGGVLLAACNDPPQGPSPVPDFRVTPAQQWSGGEVTIVSALFHDGQTLPNVSVGGVPVSVTRQDDSTVSVLLPVLSSGVAPIIVKDGKRSYDIGAVEIAGYTGRHYGSPGLNGQLVIAQGGLGPVVLGDIPNFPQPPAIAEFDPATQLVIARSGVSSPSDFVYGIGLTEDPDVYILRDSTGLVGLWRLWPTLAFVDTALSGFKGQFLRQIARFSQDVWLTTGSHDLTVTTNSTSYYLQAEGISHVYLSPRGDRATIGVNKVIAGVPVFDMATGDTAYRLPILSVGAAQFSADGSRLYAVENFAGGTSPLHLLTVDATSGTTLNETALPGNAGAMGLALNRSETQIFVGAMVDTLPAVLVYDATSFNLLGTLQATAADHCTCSSSLVIPMILMADDGAGKLYVVGVGAPAPVWSFDILHPVP